MNLAEFVKDPFTEEASFDQEGFKQAIHVAVRALNDVLEEGLPLHPLEEQRESVAKWRQIGLGIMGLGDMLLKMGLTYGSKEAVDFVIPWALLWQIRPLLLLPFLPKSAALMSSFAQKK